MNSLFGIMNNQLLIVFAKSDIDNLMKNEHKKLERLILFSEVAQTLSFTEAAGKLGNFERSFICSNKKA